jgi:hypothetical protein
MALSKGALSVKTLETLGRNRELKIEVKQLKEVLGIQTKTVSPQLQYAGVTCIELVCSHRLPSQSLTEMSVKKQTNVEAQNKYLSI